MRKKPKLTSSNVLYLMKATCDEMELIYKETAHIKILKRHVKNWLGYCEEEGVKPQDMIYDVCKHWINLRNGMHRDDGKDIVLDAVASFEQLFKFRREINRRLALCKDQWEKEYTDDWDEPVVPMQYDEWVASLGRK